MALCCAFCNCLAWCWYVGLAIGVNAAIISIVTEWLSDLKTGYCYDGWWLNQQFCCWEIEYEDENGCDSWHPWSTAWPAQYVVYIIFAVSDYAYVTTVPNSNIDIDML